MTGSESRSIPGLSAAAADPTTLRDFPGGQARGKRFRAHQKGFGPWWYAAAPEIPDHGGRFDLRDPHGTCYVANDIEAAVRERLGPRAAGRRWLPDGPVLQNTTVSVLAAKDRPIRGRIADTTHAKAAGWVTREISTILDHALTQRWATAFHDAGFAGVRYEPRLATGRVYAEGWFGSRGAVDHLPHSVLDDWRVRLPIRGTIRTVAAEIID